jgi:quinol monooxygenase YgiN
VATDVGTPQSLLIAAGVLLVGAVWGLRWPLPDTTVDRATTALHWPQPALVIEPDPREGPVMVMVEYQVDEAHRPAFLDDIVRLERSRRRTGALRWELYRDGAQPQRFVESFVVGSWDEHLRQHGDRLTGVDEQFQRTVSRHARGQPVVTHLLPP